MVRRQPKRDYREVRVFAAHRRAGHQWWKWYVIYEPLARRFGPTILAFVVLVAAWYRIPHRVLGIGALALACLVLAMWAAYSASDRNLQNRMNGVKRGTGLGWAVGGVVSALVLAAWAALWGPGA